MSLMRNKVLPTEVLRSMPTVKAAFGSVGNKGPGFDTIRMLAASAVVLHHSLKIEHDIVRDDWIYSLGQHYTHLGLLAVSVFFALSGFLVTPGLLKNGDVVGYLGRRFMRIMPLLAVIVVTTALIIGPAVTSLSIGSYYSSPETWRYLANVTTSLSLKLPGVVDYDGGDTINGPMWTLRFEWISYFMLAAASLIGFLSRRWLFLAFWAGTQILLIARGTAFDASEPRGQLDLALFLFGYFGAGVLVFLFADVLRWSVLLLGGAVSLLAVVLYLGWGAYFGPVLVAYITVGVGLIRFHWTPLLQKADLSYGIYLTHSVILMILMHLHSYTSWIALFATALPLSMGAAWLTWTFVERPALRHKSLPAEMARRLMSWARKPQGAPR